MTHARALAALMMFCGSALAAPAPVVVHSESGAMVNARTRSLASGSVGAASGSISTASDVRRSVAVQSPDLETIAIVTLDSAGALRMHPLTDSGVGASVSIASGIAASASFDAAYCTPSGNLIAAYGVSGSSTCWVRSYDGTVSSAVATPMTLGSAPVRVVVAPRPGSNEVLIVAQDSSMNLATTIWNGTSFRATASLDSAFDGGASRWDATWTRSGSAMIGWARTNDTGVRLRQLSGDAWQTLATSPSTSAAIARVELASDPSLGSATAACLLTTSSGRAEASIYDGTQWASGTQLSTTLDTTRERPADLAFEGTGGGLVCAWVESGSNQIRTRRRAGGGAWGSAANSGVVGADIEEVCVEPMANEERACVTARYEEITTGSAGGISEYVVYTANGGVAKGDRNSFTGLVGSKVAGVTFPVAPTVTVGTTNIPLNHDATQTIAPGNYRDLSFGDRTRMNFSAGTYVFRQLASSGHDSRFVCNTSAGDVTIVFNQGLMEFRDRFRIERSGTGAVHIHAIAGQFKLGHDGVLEAALYVHANSTQWGDRNRLTGHLFSKTGISVGHDGVFSTPTTWSIGGSEGSTFQHLYAMVVTAGAVGSVTALTGAGIETDQDVAVTSSRPPLPGSVRVVRWREVAPE